MALKRNTANAMWEHAQTQITTCFGKLMKFELFQEFAANSGWHEVEYPMSGTAHQCRKKMPAMRRYDAHDPKYSISLQNVTHWNGL